MHHRVLVLSLVLVAAALAAAPRGRAFAAGPPTISTVTPGSASTAGGALLTIYGNGFLPGVPTTYVSVGGVLSPSVTVNSSTQVSAVVPPGNAGNAQVVVINPDGQTAFFTGFLYTGSGAANNGSLWVAGINPVSGASTGGTVVHITGAGFDQNATVFFGGVPTSSVTWMAANYLLTYAPGGSGAVNVMVANPNGQSATAPTLFTYTGTSGATSGGLSITSIAPSVTSAGSALMISGTGFVAGATLTVGGYPAFNVLVVNSTMLTATAPSGPSGYTTVTVTNPGGLVATFAGLSYASVAAPSGQPSVSGVSPSTGSSAGGTTVSISGSGFVAPATVTFGGVHATSVTVVGSGLITATTPANPVGTVSVLVAGPSGAVGGLVAGYTYELAIPRLTSVSPSTGALAGGTTLTLSGSGFAPGATVTIGGQTAPTVSAVSPMQIVVATPPGPAGPAIILVTNPGGSISGLASAFSYSANPQPQAPPPGPTVSIAGVTPSTGPATGGTAITISGSGFLPGATVTIGGIAVASNVVSSTQIAATTPPVSGSGNVAVTVTNPGGALAALASAFHYAVVSSPPAGGSSGGSSSVVPPGGGLFVFSGGTSAQLMTASGCDPRTAVFWTTNPQGVWIGYIPAIPIAVVNAAWNALFPTTIPAGTPIFAHC